MAEMTEEQRQILRAAEDRLKKKRSPIQVASNVAAQINEGIIGALPIPFAQRGLHSIGIGSTEEPSPVDAGLRMVGATVPAAVGGAAALTARAGQASLTSIQQAGGLKGGAERVIQMIVDAYRTNPGAFVAAEAGGAFGAGTAAEVAKDAGTGPAGQLAAGLVGGAAGGIAPVTLANRGGAAVRSGIEHLAPFTEKGGMLRASRQMQARAAHPEEAALAAQSGREGVTPARRTGDDRLLAQEQHILETGDPEKARRVANDLEVAQQAVQAELIDSFGRPRSQNEWRREVIQRVAPEGVTVSVADTDRMLDQAYRGFDAAYAPARGHAASIDNMAPEIKRVISDPAIFAGKGARDTTSAWINSQLDTVQRRAQSEGAATTDDLLQFRSVIRDRQRRLGKARGEESDQAKELLEAVESVITARIERSLPAESLDSLRRADDSYRSYKLVEDAVFRSGDAQLTPQRLSESIRSGAQSRSLYARGQQDELRDLARTGRGVESVIGKPDEAALMVRGLSAQDRKPIHAEFVRHLHDGAKTTGADGQTIINGTKLKSLIRDQSDVGSSLGLSNAELQRLNRIADELIMIQKKPGQAVSMLFEDGPANLLQLGAALIGAKSGQRMAGRGLGSSLVLASFMSRKAKDTLANLTTNRAEQLMSDAVTDPKLYSALLVGPTATPRKRRNAARVINAWVAATYPESDELTDDQSAALESAKARIKAN